MSGFYYGTKEKRVLISRKPEPAVFCDAPALLLPDTVRSVLPGRLINKIMLDIDDIEEIRLRADRYASLTVNGENVTVFETFSSAELTDILIKMCKGSIYSYADDINNGFVTLDGGVRVGVSGKATVDSDRVIGVSEISSLSVRIPHRTAEVGGELCGMLVNSNACGGMLIYSPPGVGKTTLLKGMIRLLSGKRYGRRVSVIDPRLELSGELDGKELLVDILSGYPIGAGIEIAARTLNPQIIVCDEIGSSSQAASIISAHGSGVMLVASAHGRSIAELMRRPGIRILHKAAIFEYYVGISRDGRGGFDYNITRFEEAEKWNIK